MNQQQPTAPSPSVYVALCPSRQVLAMIGEKWVSLIIGALDDRMMRFGELKRCCEGVSQKMLTPTLRKLERDGLVQRSLSMDGLPLRADYRLTELGRSLVPVVRAAAAWAEAHLHQNETNRAGFILSDPQG